MHKSSLNENKALFIVIAVSVGLFIFAFLLPASSGINDFFTKLGSLVTIVGTTITYLTWSNTQKLIARRKTSLLDISAQYVIVSIECLLTKTDVEGSIVKSINNELVELKELVDGVSITVDGDRELGFPGSYF